MVQAKISLAKVKYQVGPEIFTHVWASGPSLTFVEICFQLSAGNPVRCCSAISAAYLIDLMILRDIVIKNTMNMQDL